MDQKSVAKYHFGFNQVAGAVQPTFALDALHDQVTLGIRVITAGTRDQRGARTALGTSVHPGTVKARIG